MTDTPPVDTPPVDTPPVDTPPAESWHSGFEGETLGWMENRGLTKLTASEATAKVIDGFRHAEKKLGVPSDRLVTLPVDQTVAGSMDSVYNSLGRPEASEGYELQLEKDDGDKGLAEWAKGEFHKAGLSQRQAAAVYDGFKAMTASADEAKTNEQGIANLAAEADLKREWGSTYDANLAIAKTAIQAFGLNKEPGVVEALEGILGYAGVTKFFNDLGQKMGEPNFVGADNHQGIPGMPSTPEGAQQKIQELKVDQGFVKRKLAGDSEANALWTNLHKIAHPAAA